MQDDLFEHVDCPLCRSDNYEVILKPRDRFCPEAGPVYRLTQCARCGFIFLNPRPKPEAISQFYSDAAYQPFLSTKSRLTFFERSYTLVRRFTVKLKRRAIERRTTKGRILDVGCGTGEFLDEMQRNGWQTRGIETDPQAARYARERYGLAVDTTELHGLQSGSTFDAITFWHVLEHLHDPVAAVAEASECLETGGMLVIAVPNVASLDARFYRENWVALDAPRHLHHFTPKAMQQLAGGLDLRVVEFHQLLLDAFFNCLMSEKLLLSQGRGGAIRLPFNLLRGKVMAWLSILAASGLAGRNTGQGSSILYFMQRKEDVR